MITSEDYAELYISTPSFVAQLKSLLAQQRLIFVGFGFQDPDFLRLLEVVKAFSSPARPVFAFLGDADHKLTEKKRRELFEQYNVDVIPYVIDETGSHKKLEQVLRVYNSFILKRSQKFGQPERPCPSYEPETTALLLHNTLVLKHHIGLEDPVLKSLLKAEIMSLLADRALSRNEIVEHLEERIRLIRKTTTLQNENAVRELIDLSIDELKKAGMIDGDESLELAANGLELIREQTAHSERFYEQFVSSLRGRAQQRLNETERVERVTKAAEAFLKGCIDQRALGVALAGAFGSDKQQYHIVALLQSLPEYMAQLSREEALVLVELVQELLARPSEEENRYIGLSLQARFSLNLLGQDPKLVETRMHELTKTLFLIDSSALLSMIARSCTGHDSAMFLLKRLQSLHAPVITTPLLVTEVAEHARWAIDRIGAVSPISPEALLSVSGRAGYKANLFVDGFYKELASGTIAPRFFDYLDSVCVSPAGHNATNEVFQDILQKLGIVVRNLDSWQGFHREMWAEREDLRKKITELRIAKNTYTHERQTQAEAEAVLIIEKLRSGIFTSEQSVSGAYFLSNTRVVDKVTHSAIPITMRLPAVLQWLSTITCASADELSTLTNGILWELSEGGYSVVDQAMLQQAFSPLLSASREQLAEETAALNTLTAVQYGEKPSSAYEKLGDIEVPLALNSMYIQKQRALEAEAKKLAAQKELAEGPKLTEGERLHYERLKAEKQAKRLKARRRAKNKRRRH